MSLRAASAERLRSRFEKIARLVATVGSRSNSVFSEIFDQLTEELNPSLAVAFWVKGDTLSFLTDHRLGSMVPMAWRRFKTSDSLAQPLLGALRGRRMTQVSLAAPENVAAFRAWGPRVAENDIAFVMPAVDQADVLALSVFFFNERALDDNVGQFLKVGSELLGQALASKAEREREAARSAELAETMRLATLGTLSATVAHELRGPAAALALLVPDLQRSLESSGTEAQKTVLSEMRTCVDRICGLCGQLGNLNYHDKDAEPFDLASVAGEVVALARVHAQGAGVAFEQELGEAWVVGWRDQLGQVVLNLALNAIDACREVAAGAPKLVCVKTSLVEGRAVIEVADSGPGLSKEAAERIFQPFFTTKPRGKGTGLGLSVSRDIVNSHRGHIVYGRSRWQGALFRVELPARVALGEPEVPSLRHISVSRPSHTHEPLPPPRPAFGSAPELLKPPPSGPSSGQPRISTHDRPPSRPRIGAAFSERPTPPPRQGSAPEPPPASARPAREAIASSPRPPLAPPRVPSRAFPGAAPPASPPQPAPPSRARPALAPDAASHAQARAAPARPAPEAAAPARQNPPFEIAPQPRHASFEAAARARQASFEAAAPSRQASFEAAAPSRQASFEAAAPSRQASFEAATPSRQASFEAASPSRHASFEAAAQARQAPAPGAPQQARQAPAPGAPQARQAPSPGAAAPAPTPAPQPRPRPVAGPEGALPKVRVLAVDDDWIFLRTMKRAMPEYDVTTAVTINEARQALASSGSFDVVITDVNMPGGSGLDLHRQLALERPALAAKLIFLSGGALTRADAEYVRENGFACLTKPVAHDKLLATVRSAHAGRPSPEGTLTLRPPGRE